ncbi:MAG: hypothetical protein HQK49_09060 [Oligoflexia bacterium]|nr:hypothetical protein [Oligoflexia bacterium]
MHTYYKKIAIAFVFILLLSLILISSSCSRYKDDTWDAVLLGFPAKISPEVAGVNMGLYILKQTHEPLFRINDNGQYVSKLLLEWNRDDHFKTFTFCPNTNLIFSEGKSFDLDYFKSYLNNSLKKFNTAPSEISIYESNTNKNTHKCIQINFQKPSEYFLTYLTYYENAPSLKSKDERIEYGLGSYWVDSMDNMKIILKRKKSESGKFNSIILHNFNDSSLNLNDRKIEDFNRVLIAQLPSWLAKEYTSYDVSLLQTVNLVINVKDSNLREFIYNCIDINSFRHAFVPNQKDFLSIKNILPIGLRQAQEGLPKQECNKHIRAKVNGKSITFLNWKDDNIESLTNYLKNLKKEFNVNIKLKNVSLNEFINVVLTKPHPYQLTVVALDTVRPDYSAFYYYLAGYKDCLTDIEIPPIKATLTNIQNTKEFKDQLPFVDIINKEIEKNKIILPLYQEMRKFYYPPRIKGLMLGENYLEYPEVSELEI